MAAVIRAIRLRLVAWLLPSGYAVWTWGYGHDDDLLDQPLITKDYKP